MNGRTDNLSPTPLLAGGRIMLMDLPPWDEGEGSRLALAQFTLRPANSRVVRRRAPSAATAMAISFTCQESGPSCFLGDGQHTIACQSMLS